MARIGNWGCPLDYNPSIRFLDVPTRALFPELGTSYENIVHFSKIDPV